MNAAPRHAVSLCVLLLGLSGAVFGRAASAGDGYEDEVHPRAKSLPLVIEFAPWYCARCAEEKRIPPEARALVMNRIAVADLAALLDLRDDWIAIETPHFKLLGTLEKSDLKFKDSTFAEADLRRLKTIFPELALGSQGVRLDPHQRLHLYHLRAERIYAHFAALSGNDKPFLGFPQRFELYLFQTYPQHHAYVDRFVGSAEDRGAIQWHFREEPRILALSTCADLTEAASGTSDAILGSHVIHNIAHVLVDGCDGYYRETWAWLEEGLGHYYERRETPRYNNFCWAEGAPPTEFYKPDWESTVLATLRRKKDDPFVQWCEKLRPGELTGIEHGLSWSLVRWLIEEEPLRFAKLLGTIDDTVNSYTSSQAIEATFGCSPTVLSQRWREHVLATYGRK